MAMGFEYLNKSKEDLTIEQLALYNYVHNVVKDAVDKYYSGRGGLGSKDITWATMCKTCYLFLVESFGQPNLDTYPETSEDYSSLFDLVVYYVNIKQKDHDFVNRSDLVKECVISFETKQSEETITNLVQKIRNSTVIDNKIKRSYDLLNRLLTKNYEQGSSYEKTLEELKQNLKP